MQVWHDDCKYLQSRERPLFVWACADPENQLSYIFLSNRVYPKAENNTLIDLGIRTQIHDLIYEAIIK